MPRLEIPDHTGHGNYPHGPGYTDADLALAISKYDEAIAKGGTAFDTSGGPDVPAVKIRKFDPTIEVITIVTPLIGG